MKKLIGLIVIVGVVAVSYALLKPEPTPSERLQDAAQEAGSAIGDATRALSDNAADTATDLANQAAEAAGQATEQASEALDSATSALSNDLASLQAQGQEMMDRFQDLGLLTSEGFDYDKAAGIVEESGFNAATKQTIMTILAQLRDAPEAFDAKLQELKALFAG